MVKESREDPFKDLEEIIIKTVEGKLPSRSPMRTRVIKKILKDRIDGHIFSLKQLRGIAKGILKNYMSPDGKTLERKTQEQKRRQTQRFAINR